MSNWKKVSATLAISAMFGIAVVMIPSAVNTEKVYAAENELADDYVIGNDENGIPDKNLYDAVMSDADSNRDGVLTAGEAKNVMSFTANEINITNIKGISYLKNLTNLNLYSNQISDISALSDLTKLESLYLDNNQISDINAIRDLSNLANLERLYLDNNQISDISALSGLTNLSLLQLSNNQISDISTLSGLIKLRELDLSNNGPMSRKSTS